MHSVLKAIASLKADKRTKKMVFNRNSSRSPESGSQPPQRSKNTETSNRSWNQNRNNRRNRKGRCNCDPYGPRLSGSTLATGVNITNSFSQSKQNHNQSSKWKDKDLSQIICYNCDKKRRFVNQCIKPHKPKN